MGFLRKHKKLIIHFFKQIQLLTGNDLTISKKRPGIPWYLSHFCFLELIIEEKMLQNCTVPPWENEVKRSKLREFLRYEIWKKCVRKLSWRFKWFDRRNFEILGLKTSVCSKKKTTVSKNVQNFIQYFWILWTIGKWHPNISKFLQSRKGVNLQLSDALLPKLIS